MPSHTLSNTHHTPCSICDLWEGPSYWWVGSKCSQCRQCSRSIHCLTCADLLPPLCALGSHPPSYVRWIPSTRCSSIAAGGWAEVDNELAKGQVGSNNAVTIHSAYSHHTLIQSPYTHTVTIHSCTHHTLIHSYTHHTLMHSPCTHTLTIHSYTHTLTIHSYMRLQMLLPLGVTYNKTKLPNFGRWAEGSATGTLAWSMHGLCILYCTLTVLPLYSHCTHTVLTLYSRCTQVHCMLYAWSMHTVLHSHCTLTVLTLHSHCTHTVLTLYSGALHALCMVYTYCTALSLYSHCTHTALTLYSHCTHTVLRCTGACMGRPVMVHATIRGPSPQRQERHALLLQGWQAPSRRLAGMYTDTSTVLCMYTDPSRRLAGWPGMAQAQRLREAGGGCVDEWVLVH
jgi:hypothetical protein